MKAGAVVNKLADDAVVVAAVVATVVEGKLYFLFPVLWPFSSELDWSLLLCRMYRLGQSGSKVSTIAWFSLITLSILCWRKSGATFFVTERSVGTFDVVIVNVCDVVIGSAVTGSLGRSSGTKLTGRWGKARLFSSILTIPGMFWGRMRIGWAWGSRSSGSLTRGCWWRLNWGEPVWISWLLGWAAMTTNSRRGGWWDGKLRAWGWPGAKLCLTSCTDLYTTGVTLAAVPLAAGSCWRVTGR